MEVKPLIQVLTGRCIEYAEMELEQEDDHLKMKTHLEEFQKRRDAELSITTRMEYKYNRKKEESERRQRQQEDKKILSKKAHQKYIYRNITKNLLSNFKSDIFQKAFDYTYIENKETSYLKDTYFKNIVNSIIFTIQQNQDNRNTVQKFIYNSLQIQINYHKNIISEYQEKKTLFEKKKKEQEKNHLQDKKKRRQRRIDKYNCKIRTQILNKFNEQVISKGKELKNIFESDLTDFNGVPDLYSIYTLDKYFLTFLEVLASIQPFYELDQNIVYQFLEKSFLAYYEKFDIYLSFYQEIVIKQDLCSQDIVEYINNPFLKSFAQKYLKIFDLGFECLKKIILYKRPTIQIEKIIEEEYQEKQEEINKDDNIDLEQNQDNQISYQNNNNGLQKKNTVIIEQEIELNDIDLKTENNLLQIRDKIKFYNNPQYQYNYEAIIRIRYSLNKIDINNDLEESYIEPFNGSTYQEEKLKRGIVILESIKINSFNISPIYQKSMILDEKAQTLLAQAIFVQIKDIKNENQIPEFKQIVNHFVEINQEVENLGLKKIQGEKYIPIFDFRDEFEINEEIDQISNSNQ